MTETSKKDHGSDAVQRAMGSFGPWHLVIAVAISLVKFPVAWHQLSITFLAPPPTFFCESPKSPVNATKLNKCSVDVGNGVFEQCTEFNYDRSVFKETIITEWDLVCDHEYLANVVQSVTMFGILIGNMVFSIMADRMGRKTPLMIAILLQSATGLLSAFTPWYLLFLVLKFISAVATGGTMLTSFVLLMEIVGVQWRSTISILFHVPFILGQLLNPLISYLTRRWDGFQMAVSIPPIFLLSYYWIIPESPRWLLAMGRTAEAERILSVVAEKNDIPQELVAEAIQQHEQHRKKTSAQDGQQKYNITHLFRTPNMRKKSLCIVLNWFSCGICFFGVAQYIGKFAGNIFINVAVSTAVELPGTVVILFLISRVSRIKILIGGNIVCSLSLFAIIFTSDPTVRVCLASLASATLAIVFPTVYLYSTEVFPTVVRNVGVGTGSSAARIGSMIAPFITSLDAIEPWLTPLIFGIFPLIAGVLCLMLPETFGCDLPETIEDGENFGKKKTAENVS